MLVRGLLQEDAKNAATLLKNSLPEAWSEASIIEELTLPHALMLAAVEGETLCGVLFLHILGEEFTVNTLAVSPEYRRKGVGSALLREGITLANKKGAIRGYLEVRESNLPAQHLYEKFGFEAAGKRPRFYQNPAEDAIVMIWREEK